MGQASPPLSVPFQGKTDVLNEGIPWRFKARPKLSSTARTRLTVAVEELQTVMDPIVGLFAVGFLKRKDTEVLEVGPATRAARALLKSPKSRIHRELLLISILLPTPSIPSKSGHYSKGVDFNPVCDGHG